jgi:hypothetical protein
VIDSQAVSQIRQIVIAQMVRLRQGLDEALDSLRPVLRDEALLDAVADGIRRDIA